MIPKAGVVVFVHWCFWHGHHGCRFRDTPTSRTLFWKDKLAKNARRDRRATRAMRELGWSVAVVWECRLAKPGQVHQRLARIIVRLSPIQSHS